MHICISYIQNTHVYTCTVATSTNCTPCHCMTKATNQTEGDSGMGSLGRNIEFMFLKVAELETIVELQQAQITSLTDRLNAVENKTGLVQKDWET